MTGHEISDGTAAMARSVSEVSALTMLFRHGDSPGGTFVNACAAVDALVVDDCFFVRYGDGLRRTAFHAVSTTRTFFKIYNCCHVVAFLFSGSVCGWFGV